MFVFYSFKDEELPQRKNQTTPKIHEMQMREYEWKKKTFYKLKK